MFKKVIKTIGIGGAYALYSATGMLMCYIGYSLASQAVDQGANKLMDVWKKEPENEAK